MTTPKRIRVEIGIPSQIEPGQEVEVESVPGITAYCYRMTAGQDGGMIRIEPEGGITIQGMTINQRHVPSPMSSDGADCA